MTLLWKLASHYSTLKSLEVIFEIELSHTLNEKLFTFKVAVVTVRKKRNRLQTRLVSWQMWPIQAYFLQGEVQMRSLEVVIRISRLLYP